jgi:hypothetical protein
MRVQHFVSEPRYLIAAILVGVLAGCSQPTAPPASSVSVSKAPEFRLTVSSEAIRGVRIDSGVPTLAPNQTCVFRGSLKWPEDAEDLLLFEIQKSLPHGKRTTVANGEVKILSREDGIATFEVQTAIGSAEFRDCEAVVYSHRRVDGHIDVLAQAPIQILK